MQGKGIMNVVICDDEKSTCAEVENVIRAYADERNVKMEVDIFFSGSTLTAYLEKGGVLDILFLDIEIPGKNGVAVGNYIRSVLDNDQIFICLLYTSPSPRDA